MAVKVIYELIDLFGNTDFSITANNKAGSTVSLINNQNAKRYLTKKYATRQYPVILGTHATLSDAIDDLAETYHMYLVNHKYGIDKQYQAIFDYNYSPIENVDRYENETTNIETSGTHGNTRTNNLQDATTYGKTETNTGTDTTTYGHVITQGGVDSVAETGSDTLSKSGAIVNTHDKVGFNNTDTYTQDTKDTETYNSYDETTQKGTTERTTYGHTDTNSGSDTFQHGHIITDGGSDSQTHTGTVTDSGTDSGSNDTDRELHVHGNIGVTSNVDLITQELELRKISLAEQILDDFVNAYTYYS